MNRGEARWRRLGLGTAARQVAHLSVGAGVSQLILFAAQIALGTMFTQAEFGAYSVAQGLGALFAIVITGRYEMAIPLADTDDDARGLTWLCVTLALVGSTALLAVAALATWLGGPSIETRIGTHLWLIPLVTLGMALFTTQRLAQGRHERYGLVARAGVTGTLLQVLVQLGGGAAGAPSSVLTVGYVLGRLSSSAEMMRGSRRGTATRSPRPDGSQLRRLAHTWREFPIWNTWPALLNTVSASGVAPLVGAFYGLAFAGIYGYAAYFLAAPAALLSQAVSGVLLPRMAGLERAGGDTRASLHRAASALTYVSVAFFGAVILLGPEAFALIPPFGRWREAGTVAALLAPWLACSFVSSPLSTYATVRRRLKRILVVSVVEAVLRVATLALGTVIGGPLVGVAAFSAAGVAITVYFIAWTLRLAGSSIGIWARSIRSFLLPAGLTLLVGLAARALDLAALPVGIFCSLVLAALGVRAVLGLRRVA